MDARRAARPAKDLDTWARLTADDAMEIHSDGRVHTKTEEIAEIKAGTPPARPDGPDTDIKVRMYGSTAVYTAQRNPSDGPRRLAVVWVKGTAEQWRVVLTQQSPLSKP